MRYLYVKIGYHFKGMKFLKDHNFLSDYLSNSRWHWWLAWTKNFRNISLKLYFSRHGLKHSYKKIHTNWNQSMEYVKVWNACHLVFFTFTVLDMKWFQWLVLIKSWCYSCLLMALSRRFKLSPKLIVIIKQSMHIDLAKQRLNEPELTDPG